jgi:hypothetical protein
MILDMQGLVTIFKGIEDERLCKLKENKMAITDEQILNWFTYHNDPADVPKFAAINEAAINLAKVIRDNTPSSADQTAAIRLVREARMTANAAVACKGA